MRWRAATETQAQKSLFKVESVSESFYKIIKKSSCLPVAGRCPAPVGGDSHAGTDTPAWTDTSPAFAHCIEIKVIIDTCLTVL